MPRIIKVAVFGCLFSLLLASPILAGTATARTEIRWVVLPYQSISILPQDLQGKVVRFTAKVPPIGEGREYIELEEPIKLLVRSNIPWAVLVRVEGVERSWLKLGEAVIEVRGEPTLLAKGQVGEHLLVLGARFPGEAGGEEVALVFEVVPA